MTALVPREPRPTCQGCERPASVCICAHLVRRSPATRVVIVQHPREERTAIGTAAITHACLEGSALFVGVAVDDAPAVTACLEDPARPAVLLYPGEGAQPLEALAGAAHTLVVLDGTWPQSKTLLKRNPRIASLPRVAFTPEKPSEYRIRREPRPAYVSTIESVAHALRVLERDATYEGLLAPFRAMVDHQLAREADGRNPRKKRARSLAPRHARLFPELLDDAAQGRCVCVVAEANAWPYKAKKGAVHPPDELVQLVAVRPSTGERIDLVVRPRGPLASGTVGHTRLSAEELASGLDLADARAEAARFFRPTDHLVTWGHYATNLALREGLVGEGHRITCLRTASKRLRNGKIGAVEDLVAHEHLDPGPALGRGRAGTRLACTVATLGLTLGERPTPAAEPAPREAP